MKDVNAFFRALDYPVQKMATFFVPATIRMLLQFAPDRLAAYGHKLDFIESGAAPLPEADMLRLCELLPNTRLYNTYASTETGIIATYNYNERQRAGKGASHDGKPDGKSRPVANCLGRAMPHSRVLITAEGLISCQGDTLMSGYVGDPELTATVLRDNTIFTSDVGTIDEEGMLHITGRVSDVINVGGFKVSPIEVESAAMSSPMVSDCICISAEHPVTGRALKLLVVTPSSQPLDKRALARYLAGRLEPYKVPMLYEQVDTIARTYNGKLDRKHYL
jgi:acyl-CoA synthetase (AMP-forming)/AMP-acid ligase II